MIKEPVFIVCGISAVIVAFCLGHEVGETWKAKQAINAGVAEWYLDANAEKAFRWKTNHFEK